MTIKLMNKEVLVHDIRELRATAEQQANAERNKERQAYWEGMAHAYTYALELINKLPGRA